MSGDSFGHRTGDFIGEFDDERTLRLEVEYRHSARAVWTALTDPDEAARWFMLVPLGSVEGAAVMMRSLSRGVDTGVRGSVTVYDEPRLLEYEFSDVLDSVLNFGLEPLSGGCRLTFTQRLARKIWSHAPDDTDHTLGPEAAPGWQDFLVESLNAHLDGHPLPTPSEVAARKLLRTEQCRALLAARFA
jgi:uncharacterized protein YndB with AHSA1/START domain